MNWYILHTKTGGEDKLAASLASKGYEYFLPRFTCFDPGKLRTTKTSKSLIDGFLFVYIHPGNLPALLQMRGVKGCLYWLNNPAIILEEEILMVRSFLAEFEQVGIEKSKVRSNDLARISSVPVDQENYRSVSGEKMIKLVLPSIGFTLTAAEVPKSGLKEILPGKTMTNF